MHKHINCLAALLLSISFPASAADDTAAVNASPVDRIAELEKAVKKLDAEIAKINQRKVKLECRTVSVQSSVGNDFTAIASHDNATSPANGWRIVAGGCKFDSWNEREEPFFIHMTPDINDGVPTSWRCWGKNPRAISATAVAVLCRAVLE